MSLPQVVEVTGLRILLADDNEILRRTVAKLLALRGHVVSEAKNGTEVLERFVTSASLGLPPPEMLVLDVDMPGQLGSELLVLFREAGSEVPVVLITGNNTAALRALAAEQRAVVVDKPFSMQTLERAAERARRLVRA